MSKQKMLSHILTGSILGCNNASLCLEAALVFQTGPILAAITHRELGRPPVPPSPLTKTLYLLAFTPISRIPGNSGCCFMAYKNANAKQKIFIDSKPKMKKLQQEK